MPEFTRDGVRLVYDDSGSGPAIVLSHCWFCDGTQWPQADSLARAGYRVLNLDNRGHGRSGPHRTRYTLGDLAGDLLRVLDHAGEQRAVLVGLSLGGFAALRAAVRYPDRVRAIAVAGVRLPTPRERAQAWLSSRLVRSPVRPLLYPGMLKTLPKLLFGPTSLRRRPELIAYWQSRFATQDPVSMAFALDAAAVTRDDFTSQLTRIGVPTLVLTGDEDYGRGLAASMAGAIPGSRFVTLPAAGHLSAVEAPEAFGDALLSFLRELEPTKPTAELAPAPAAV